LILLELEREVARGAGIAALAGGMRDVQRPCGERRTRTCVARVAADRALAERELPDGSGLDAIVVVVSRRDTPREAHQHEIGFAHMALRLRNACATATC